MIGIPGFSKKLFTALNESEINVILITQSASEHSICVGVHQSASEKSTEVLNKTFQQEIAAGEIKSILLEDELSIIALVGDKMKSHPGISGKMFSALGRNGINIRAIAQGSNEINISAVIKTAEIEKALNVLHEAFFEDTKKEINLFIIGAGNVGKKLIQQISEQSEKIDSLQKIKLNIAGICNSRKMIIDEKGIDKINWQNLLNEGAKADPGVFINNMTSINLRNSVLVDMTANEFIPSQYQHVLSKSMSVVACNKIAASGNFETYKSLKDLAISYNCKFLFETNVGAALPIIGTLNDLIKSGDKINKINAVLSGTLNFVFNNYDGIRSFAQVVKQAQEEGYTEPDPRLDLSGKDVMRKIMILVREAGIKIEMDQITCNSFLPASCMEGTVEDFYVEMEKHEPHFKSLLDEANNNNAKLKFVATFNDGKASVGLQHISQENEMYHLYGKDNIVLFHTERYNDQPLVIKGAGAGADVTASGVFADILRSINN
jgi:aspartokinase/homoserine dehydrogenase 1